MTPPYKLIDQATDEVATGPNGERWENMDVAPGNTIELYNTTRATTGPMAARVAHRHRAARRRSA